MKTLQKMNQVKRGGIMLACSLLILTGLSSVVTQKASAVTASDFQAGRIIDDNVFYNGSTIAASTIQAFLQSKVPTCDTNHAASNGYSPPFTCLKDYRQDTPNEAADAYCNTYTGGAAEHSYDIIFKIGQACNINPEVLIVLLEKEQSLVTDTWPVSTQYQIATGYGCPDSSPNCDSDYYGFFNQVYNAAHQFQRYRVQSSLFRYRSGITNTIQYSPNSTCGSSDVFIQNQSTASLYNYTPYQPDAAALSNLNGQGDTCSAYGNRNFWRLFNDWFGPTTSNSTANTLNFVRVNHYSGKVEVVGYPSIGSYGYANRNVLVPYTADSTVVPLFRPNGDISLVKLNDPSGKVLITTYSAASNFQQLSSQIYAAYPSVAADGSVVPLFRPNGDLSFIRLNHYSGHVEVVTYSLNSYFQQLSSQIYAAYPSVAADGSVVPLFRPNGDLSFIRLNHYSGHVEVVTYSLNSYFQQLSSQIYAAYPSVAADGSVTSLFLPNGDLSFVRLNYSGGQAEDVTYSLGSYYQVMTQRALTAYPSVTDFQNVKVLSSR